MENTLDVRSNVLPFPSRQLFGKIYTAAETFELVSRANEVTSENPVVFIGTLTRETFNNLFKIKEGVESRDWAERHENMAPNRAWSHNRSEKMTKSLLEISPNIFMSEAVRFAAKGVYIIDPITHEKVLIEGKGVDGQHRFASIDAYFKIMPFSEVRILFFLGVGQAALDYIDGNKVRSPQSRDRLHGLTADQSDVAQAFVKTYLSGAGRRANGKFCTPENRWKICTSPQYRTIVDKTASIVKETLGKRGLQSQYALVFGALYFGHSPNEQDFLKTVERVRGVFEKFAKEKSWPTSDKKKLQAIGMKLFGVADKTLYENVVSQRITRDLDIFLGVND